MAGPLGLSLPMAGPLGHPHYRPTFIPIDVMLRELLQPDVSYYITFDLKSWFVQICTHPFVAWFFSTRLKDESLWRVCGIPMGWAWAPTIAHALCTALARIIIAVFYYLFLLAPSIIVHVYVDNVIFGIGGNVLLAIRAAAILRDISTAVAAQFNIIIKQSSWAEGVTIDWLGVILNSVSHTGTVVTSDIELDPCLSSKSVTTLLPWHGCRSRGMMIVPSTLR
jgi:hypothetical protein